MCEFGVLFVCASRSGSRQLESGLWFLIPGLDLMSVWTQGLGVTIWLEV